MEGNMIQCIYVHNPFLFQKHLKYKLISNNNIMTAVIGVPMAENNLTSLDD